MNAPASPAGLQVEAFRILPIATLAPSSTRTQIQRRARFKKEELEELARSIKAVGVLQPIVVRPHPTLKLRGGFEIVAGERRFLGAQLAGVAELPVVVREISDADLVEFQLIENLQRKTIDQLDEAQGYAELRQLKKLTPEQVAERVGVSRSTVFNRLKLLDLCPEARKALEEGKLPTSNAMLIARVGHHDTQREVLKRALTGGYEGTIDGDDGSLEFQCALSYRQLAGLIQRDYMVDLKGASFKLDDAALLPKAGSCAACPKRSGNQKDLFADVKNPNVCTDPKCYDDKRQAVFKIKADELRAKGRKVLAGADAKKVFPNWKRGYDEDRVGGGFHAMDEKLYVSGDAYGKTPKQLLGKDYEPIVALHPTSGDLIEVASAQAVAAAAKGKKPERDEDDDIPGIRRAPKPKTPKVNLPDLDDQVAERIAQLLYAKQPKAFTRGFLLAFAKLAFTELGGDKGGKLDLIAKQYGWPKGAFGKSWQDSYPKLGESFDERKIIMLLFLRIWANGWGAHGHPDVLEHFGIDDDKVREQIIAERKAAQAAARAKAKLQKASPIVKTKVKKAAKGKKK